MIINGSTLPSLFPLSTEKSLCNVDFSVEDIKNIISKLDSNKAHGGDIISIRMLKLCDTSICNPLSIIFKSCLTKGIFLAKGFRLTINGVNLTFFVCKSKELLFFRLADGKAFSHLNGKKQILYQFIKNTTSKCVKNYRPVYLLPICSKAFERIIYNTMFTYFMENNLLSENQSGFKPGDSCIDQSLTVTH